MRGLNQVTLLGNIGGDVNLQAKSVSVAKFSLATTEKYKETETTEWHNVVCFGRLAETVSEYCRKGDRLLVQGRIHYNTHEQEDGTKRYYTDIIADEVIFLNSRGEQTTKKEVRNDSEDIPF